MSMFSALDPVHYVVKDNKERGDKDMFIAFRDQKDADDAVVILERLKFNGKPLVGDESALHDIGKCTLVFNVYDVVNSQCERRY